MVAETVASSVLMTGANASTVMDSVTEPGDSVKSFRTTWLMLTMLPECFTRRKPQTRPVTSYVPTRTKVDTIVPVLVGDHCVVVARGRIHRRDFGSRDGFATRIRNRSD
jgi:hypothetical protein